MGGEGGYGGHASGLNPRPLGFNPQGEKSSALVFFSPAFAFKTLFVFSGILEKKKNWGRLGYKSIFFPAEYDPGTPRGQGERRGGL